jgi:hypothetical protein
MDGNIAESLYDDPFGSSIYVDGEHGDVCQPLMLTAHMLDVEVDEGEGEDEDEGEGEGEDEDEDVNMRRWKDWNMGVVGSGLWVVAGHLMGN